MVAFVLKRAVHRPVIIDMGKAPFSDAARIFTMLAELDKEYC